MSQRDQAQYQEPYKRKTADSDGPQVSSFARPQMASCRVSSTKSNVLPVVLVETGNGSTNPSLLVALPTTPAERSADASSPHSGLTIMALALSMCGERRNPLTALMTSVRSAGPAMQLGWSDAKWKQIK